MSYTASTNALILYDNIPVPIADILTGLNSQESVEYLANTANIGIKQCYTTGEVAQILKVSLSFIINLCSNWEFEERELPRLEFYKVGTHRRIPHHALVKYFREWN